MTAAATATPEELLAGLAAVLDDVAGTPAEKVVPEAAFDKDLDIDSLTMVEVVVACEEKFGVRIPDEALGSVLPPRLVPCTSARLSS